MLYLNCIFCISQQSIFKNIKGTEVEVKRVIIVKLFEQQNLWNKGANHQEWGDFITQELYKVPLHYLKKFASLDVSPDFWNTA